MPERDRTDQISSICVYIIRLVVQHHAGHLMRTKATVVVDRCFGVELSVAPAANLETQYIGSRIHYLCNQLSIFVPSPGKIGLHISGPPQVVPIVGVKRKHGSSFQAWRDEI